MKLRDKLTALKESVTESVEEFAETSELSAEDYAKYYGASYTNLLNYIKKQKFTKMTNDYNENIAETMEDFEFSMTLNIASIKDKDIIFADEVFGAKEIFNMTILKNLLYKARISFEISEDLSTMTLTDDKTERLSDQLEKLNESKDAYIGKAKEMVNEGNKLARNKAKELLKKASEWADTNL